MTWWVIVGLGHDIGFTDLRVFASTDIPDHLWMSWAYHKPMERRIRRVSRGVAYYCGYKYGWDTPFLTEQSDSADTLIHRFHISNLHPRTTIWYYLHAPGGPFGLEIQGPLTHVNLLRAPTWATCVYFASRTKGMFKTTNFSGPGAPQPTWIPDNAGLPFLDIHQACPDPWDPYHRRFVICHGQVYRMDNTFVEDPATATLVLSFTDALNLTGSTGGNIFWIANNHTQEGHFYVLFNSDLTDNGIWCLKTIDYGQSWTAHQIYDGPWNYAAGNIQAGNYMGTSPWLPGEVIYAALIIGAGGNLRIYRSTDEGDTWHPCSDQPPGYSVWQPRLHVDPTDQSIVYVGAQLGGPDLWRTMSSGAAWSLCDQGNHLGINLHPIPIYGIMGINTFDPEAIRVLKDLHIWKTSDWGMIWRDQGEVQYKTPHLHYKDHSPDWLYLARIINAPTGDGLYAPHVIFVSDDEGSNMFGKAGAHANEDDGRYDSIPYNCGGVAHEGLIPLPWPRKPLPPLEI